MDESIKNEYRKQLIDLEKSIHESYDKTLITLSGGALATSIAFYKDIIGNIPIEKKYATCAWIIWSISLTVLILALYFGTLAYGYARKKLDADELNEENPGGYWTYIIKGLNALGIITFISGLILFLIFISKN